MNLPQIGILPELDNIQINHYFSQNHFYGGCISKNELKLKIKDVFYIINLADDNKPGTHWVLLYNVDPETVIYFDPMGVPFPPLEIKDTMKKIEDKTKQYNGIDIQALTSESCGYYCVYVVDKLFQLNAHGKKNIKLRDVIKAHFYVKQGNKGERLNEQVLQNYFKNVFNKHNNK